MEKVKIMRNRILCLFVGAFAVACACLIDLISERYSTEHIIYAIWGTLIYVGSYIICWFITEVLFPVITKAKKDQATS